jgi:hypothetical protein
MKILSLMVEVMLALNCDQRRQRQELFAGSRSFSDGLQDSFNLLDFKSMSTVAEIEAAIEKLPLREQQQLRAWFARRKPRRVSVLQKLRSLAGSAKNLPADLAANHDHYLHGTAKRS